MSTNLDKSDTPLFDDAVGGYCKQLAEVITERLGKLKDEDGYLTPDALGIHQVHFEDGELPLEELVTSLLGEWGFERISSFCDIKKAVRSEFRTDTSVDIALWEQFEKRAVLTAREGDVFYEDDDIDHTRASRHVMSWDINLAVR